MITIEQAKILFNLAKSSINSFFLNEELVVDKKVKDMFKDKKGIFVSLYIDDELRGCIGFPEPIKELWEGTIEAAKGAAFEDPRFEPLSVEEFKKVKMELSILTKPEVIEVSKPEEYLKKIKIGKDGLMIKDEFGKGLLLPQIALELGWDSKRFLEETCKKAGLEPECWNNMKRNVYKFNAQIFKEEKGKIVEKNNFINS